MFSLRTNWPRAENRFSRVLAELQRSDAPLLDLTVANPTEVGLAYPTEEILAALAVPAALSHQPSPWGRLEAREAIAAHLERDGRRGPAADCVLLTASTSESYSHLFKLLADPGDAILAPSPSYPLFEYLAGLESLTLRPYPLRYDGRWHLDRDALRRAAAEPRVRAIVAIHPNNPTGSYLARDELAFLAEICAARGLALICDEVFLDFPLCDDPERAPSALSQSRCLTFCLGGLSKQAGLPQLKLGWIAASGPDAALREALARLEILADTYLSVGAPVQLAAPALLAWSARFQAQLSPRLRANVAAAKEILAAPAALSALHVDGGWSLVLRLPSVQSSEGWALELAERHQLVVQPGYLYDFEEEACVVVSLLTPEGTFAAGLRTLERAVAARLAQTPAR